MLDLAVEPFYLQPTPHSPNSPLPVLLYRGVLPSPFDEESATQYLEEYGWEKRGTWGHIEIHHFHPNTHECYGVFRGSSTLLLGQGKLDNEGGIQIPVKAGDVIVIPAGITHTCLESQDDYQYIGLYPREAPRWRSEYGDTPVDLQEMRKEILNVAMPDQDPIYGGEGPLIRIWNDALASEQEGASTTVQSS